MGQIFGVLKKNSDNVLIVIVNVRCPGAVSYGNGNLEDPEEYLETLDRKVSEIMNKDQSRRYIKQILINKFSWLIQEIS